MDKKSGKKELLERIRKGVRLRVKPPKAETPKKAYTRKAKHKRRFDKESPFFLPFPIESFLRCMFIGL